MFSADQIHLTLLSICLATLVALIFIGLAILKRLARIESQQQEHKSAQLVSSSSSSQALPEIETSPGGAFEMFLEEDAARLTMAKSEQFKAYRKWRQEKGMNWSNS